MVRKSQMVIACHDSGVKWKEFAGKGAVVPYGMVVGVP